ncbi:hypothetical protein D3C87_252910 [compost metagenome]
MIRLKLFLSSLVLLMTSSALADWSLVGGMGAFMGEHYLGGSYRSNNDKHRSDLTIGFTEGIYQSTTYQLNFKYLYSPVQREYEDFTTNYAGIGVMVTRCLCSEGFVQNLDIYPERNYYDETAYRFGLVVSHQVRWKKVEFYWDWVLLDQLAIAVYNNPSLRQRPEDYVSAGLGLRIFPDL